MKKRGRELRTRRGYRAKPIPGLAPYWVSEAGTVYVYRRGKFRLMKQQINPDGYRRVTLWFPKRLFKKKNFYVHRLVMMAFVGPVPDGKEVCHGPKGNKCNRLDNLRYDTPKENVADRVRDRYARRYGVPSERFNPNKTAEETFGD